MTTNLTTTTRAAAAAVLRVTPSASLSEVAAAIEALTGLPGLDALLDLPDDPDHRWVALAGRALLADPANPGRFAVYQEFLVADAHRGETARALPPLPAPGQASRQLTLI